jgi:hypothetical protein
MWLSAAAEVPGRGAAAIHCPPKDVDIFVKGRRVVY